MVSVPPFAGERDPKGSVDHGSTASTSISTVQAGSMSDVTTVVFTGRISAKTSPWALATPAKWSACVTSYRR